MSLDYICRRTFLIKTHANGANLVFISPLTLSSLNLPLSSSSTTSRDAVDEDDVKWVANGQNDMIYIYLNENYNETV